MSEQLPIAFCERLQQIVPAEQLQTVLQSFNQLTSVCFRANTLKITPDDLLTLLSPLSLEISRHPHFENVFYIPTAQRPSLTHSEAHDQGLLYLQNLSSMLAARILDAKPGEEVLDCCAAPGSKTSLIACMMQDQGRIAAVEKIRNRFFKLKQVLSTQGVSMAELYLKDASSLWRYCANQFDRILVDTPCSSESRFNLHQPESYSRWSIDKIKQMTRKQYPILSSAFQCLKPGGTLVYSTCSFAPEENELIIAKLIKKYPEHVQLQPIELPIDNSQTGLTQWQQKPINPLVKHCLRILPNRFMSGFFLCKLIKKP